MSNPPGFQEKMMEEISLRIVVEKKITSVKIYPSGKQETSCIFIETDPVLFKIGEKKSTDEQHVYKFIPNTNLTTTLSLSNGLFLCLSVAERNSQNQDSLSICAKALVDLGTPQDSIPRTGSTNSSALNTSGQVNRYSGKETSDTDRPTQSNNFSVGLRSDGVQQTLYSSSGLMFDDERSNESSNYDSLISTGHSELDYSNGGQAMVSSRQGGGEISQNMFVSSEVLVETDKIIKSHKPKTTGSISCNVCGKSFFTEKQLLNHKNFHEGQRKDGKFHCSICNRTYNKRTYYLSHKRTVKCDLTRLWNCSNCDKSFSNQGALKTHLKFYHSDEAYRCKCKKNFTSLKSFTRHRAKGCVDYSQPKDPAIYRQQCKCETCGRVLCSKGSLERHMRLHTGEKPCICKICGNGYTSKSVLWSHVLYKHTNHRPHLCQQCGKRFKKSSELRVHLNVHSKYPFQCSICGRFYMQVEKMERHQARLHASVKEDGHSHTPKLLA